MRHDGLSLDLSMKNVRGDFRHDGLCLLTCYWGNIMDLRHEA